MNATPVIKPATVTDVLQPAATEPLSKKKKAVAANIPIEINQKEIPTKSSEANNTVSAFAAPIVALEPEADGNLSSDGELVPVKVLSPCHR